MATRQAKGSEEDSMWRGRMKAILWAAGVLRCVLVAYSEWHDAHLEVPYTDVDYYVFSDAAALMKQGKSPFKRSTYRYSPLLALILVPNSWLHRCWGKLLFSAADLLVAHLICRVLMLRGVSKRQCTICAASWLFNPFTFSVGTRGNCEALICAMILWLLHCLMTGKLLQASVWFGIVVHVRIYPIIYVFPILSLLDKDYWSNNDGPYHPHAQEMKGLRSSIGGLLRNSMEIINPPRVIFGAVSGGIFFTLCGAFYYLYGMEYLQESLLYHLTRSDHRHNFSIYFYSIYLREEVGVTMLERLLAFIPQMAVQAVLISFFAKDLPFCLFVQTFAFVAFNKVITAQYFVWFFCLVPLILPFTTLKLRWRGVFVMTGWTLAQVHWLGWAYLLEFKGKNVFLPLWVAGLVFFTANIVVLCQMISHHSFCPLLCHGKLMIAKHKDESKEI